MGSHESDQQAGSALRITRRGSANRSRYDERAASEPGIKFSRCRKCELKDHKGLPDASRGGMVMRLKGERPESIPWVRRLNPLSPKPLNPEPLYC